MFYKTLSMTKITYHKGGWRNEEYMYLGYKINYP